MASSQHAVVRGSSDSLRHEIRSVVKGELEREPLETLAAAAIILTALLTVAMFLSQSTLDHLLQGMTSFFSELLPANVALIKSLNGKFIFVAAAVFSFLAYPSRRRKASLFRILWAFGWWSYALRYGTWPDRNADELMDADRLDAAQAVASAATDLLFSGAAFSAYIRIQNPRQSDVLSVQKDSGLVWPLSRTTGIAFGIATLPVIAMTVLGFQSVQTFGWVTLCGVSVLAVSFELACYRDVFIRTGSVDRATMTTLFLVLYAAIQALFPYALLSHALRNPSERVLHQEVMVTLLVLVFAVRVFFATFLFVWVKSAIDSFGMGIAGGIRLPGLTPDDVDRLNTYLVQAAGLNLRPAEVGFPNSQSRSPANAPAPAALPGGRDLANAGELHPPETAESDNSPQVVVNMHTRIESHWRSLALWVTLVVVLVFCARFPRSNATPFLLVSVGIAAAVAGFRAVLGFDRAGDRDSNEQDDQS